MADPKFYRLSFGLTANGLARCIDVPGNRISSIIAGRRGMTGETALRLTATFGTSAEFWMNLQKSYKLEKARDVARRESVDFESSKLSA